MNNLLLRVKADSQPFNMKVSTLWSKARIQCNSPFSLSSWQLMGSFNITQYGVKPTFNIHAMTSNT